MFLRLKLWLANLLGVRRLQQHTEFLLISNLNLATAREDGAASHRRLTDLFLELLDALDPTAFCDIGANDASMARLVRQRRPACRVLAFEANPAIHARHRDAAAAAGVTYLDIAVSDRDGTATVYVPLTLSRAVVAGRVVPARITEAEETGKSSLLQRDESATYQEYEVPARRLDPVLRAHLGGLRGQRLALWIDVEGAADKVLAGARASLRRTVAIVVETETFGFWRTPSRSAHIARQLIGAGFVPVARDREYGDTQFNTLFLHRDVLPLVHDRLFEIAAAPAVRNELAAPAVFRGLAASLLADTPVLIPAFNNESYVRGMLAQLQARGLRRLIVVDNASTSESFRAFLRSLRDDASVVWLPENRGPRDLVADAANFAALPELFCVTDPDLQLNAELPEDFLAELLAVSRRHKVGKVGFALDIADRAALRDDPYVINGQTFRIWEWEAKFWDRPVGTTRTGDTLYRAEIDTTFALYNKAHFSQDCPNEAIRVAGRYTCRHLPWYKDIGMPPDEEALYRATQKFSYYLPGGRFGGAAAQG